MALAYRYSYPTRTRAELWADGLAHLTGILWAIWMLGGAVSPSEQARAVILVVLFTTSAAYHLTPVEACREHLRRMDHATIFLVIPAISAPLATGTALVHMFWICALVAAVAKLLIGRWREDLSQATYLILSACSTAILIAHIPLATILTSSAFLLAGLVMFNIRALPFNMAIWHLCVVAGLGSLIS